MNGEEKLKELKDAIIDVPGIKVGHSQDLKAGTGCTVIICEKGATTGVDVRGGAPGTRETDLLNPVNLIDKAHAIYLGGGSAFGLDGASGVMKYLEEKRIGFDVVLTKVPIVPGAVLFDLDVGDFRVRPDANMGYDACIKASEEVVIQGNVGAGTGATVGKIFGGLRCMKSGLGTASFKSQELIIGAIVAVNCLGDVIDPENGEIIAGVLTEDKKGLANSMSFLRNFPQKTKDNFSKNTTIGAIATNARLSKAGATKVAMMAQDGYARTINPAHTMFDGDTIFCMATGEVEAGTNVVGAIAAEVMARAIVKAVKNTESLFKLKSYKDIF
ncbi:MAG TPA: peptidase S58 family protein [Candidatus Atribacteria bacterium]|nr:peptidase S58 family protein [Candidatus Atribacteria bacterium]